jgi:hypothetical protein
MGSSDRWNYVNQSPISRGSLPGGYNVVNMGHGNQGIVEFDNISGLHRRVGTRPLYEDLLRQGCTPTGQRTGPPGFESDVYNCPNSPAGSPAWFQTGQPTVFGGLAGLSFTEAVVPLAVVIAVGAVVYYGAEYLFGRHGVES